MISKQLDIYVKKEDVEKIMKDNRITHLHLQGHIGMDKEDDTLWNITATGYAPDTSVAASLKFSTCPHPCK